MASAGLAHLVNGTEPLTGGYDGLAAGGGAFGALVAVPLKTYIGAWAGALACVFVGLLGLCIITKTPLRRAARTIAIGIWAAIIWLRTNVPPFVRSLYTREAEPKPVPEPVIHQDLFGTR